MKDSPADQGIQAARQDWQELRDSFQITDTQLKAARLVNGFTESQFYGKHDADEMEAIALDLGIVLDDLKSINKTTLRKACFTAAASIIEVGSTERAVARTQKAIDEWPASLVEDIARFDEDVRKAAAKMTENPWAATDSWNLEKLARLNAQLKVRYELVRYYFRFSKDLNEWISREDEDDHNPPTIMDIRNGLVENCVRHARNGTSRSTSTVSNLIDDLKAEAFANVLRDVARLCDRAVELDIIVPSKSMELYLS